MLRPGSVFSRLTQGWHGVVLAVAAAATTIAGCGGGVGVGGTGAYAAGPISGFGSVFVNGIRFDDTSATITTEDGAALSRASLGLGMFAEVDSGPIGGTATEPTATATKIRISSQLVGPVSGKTADTLTVVDQTVQVTATTVYDSSIAAGLPAIATGNVLEVYGFFDASAGRLIATRIELKTSAPSKWKVRGVVANLNATPGTFTIGGGTFSFTGTPAGLSNGAYVAVEVQPTASGPWVVTKVGEGQRQLPELDRVELKGSITTFASATSFSVNGQPVDASTATVEGTGLGLGVRVEVRGAVSGGVLRASRVEIQDSGSSGGGGGGGGGGGSVGAFEFKDAISGLDTAAKTFVVKGFTIRYAGALYEGGSEASLANGRQVQVKANPTTTANTYTATNIKFE